VNEPEYIDPKKLRPGPIRHESLAPELLAQLGAVFEAVGPYLNMTLEQFELGFMRNAHPEREIAIWCRIAKAWLAYHEDFLGSEWLPREEEKKLIGALLLISMGVKGLEKLNVPPDVARRLMWCYEDPATPL
jgi:hypothetical protein